MKIFMFVNYSPYDKSLGITKKIDAEISALKRLGHSVVYTAYKTDGVGVFNDRGEQLYSEKYITSNKKIQGIIRYFALIHTAQRYINKIRDFDLCYGRLLAPNTNYLRLLKTLKTNGCKIVLEAHAYFPGIKFRTIKGKYVSFMLEKNGHKLGSLVDRILTEGHIDNFYGIPEVVETKIGVETDKFSVHTYAGNKEQLNLISVANETVYHGYDRVINSLGTYYKTNKEPEDIRIHLVGTISDSTKDLAASLNLNDRVVFYGKQYGEKLDEIYNTCNMGMGPLGQHRVGGKKDTGLKTKEYFAKGLPYIFSGEEPTVPNDYPYICCFPSDESLIDFDKVWEFYKSFRDKSNVVEEMREFAKENYSWDTIMEEALNHLK